jgi:transcriptional regulator with XRE-family HTH domain
MSQVQLAELAGRTSRWLVRVESGQGDVRLSDLVKLSEALGTTVSDLIEERAPAPSSDVE